MPRLFQKLLGGLWWVLNFRPLRLFVLLTFLLWGFDCAVTFWTDAAWFASMGHGSTFWHSRLLQIGLFTAFFVVSLAVSIPFIRVIAHPVDAPQSAVSFPRALDFLGHWHALAPKLSWLVVLITAFLCAHSFGANWMAFEAMRYAPNVLGLNEKFWIGTLPFASLLLGLLWKFSIVLLLVVALGGGVRSLPFLATRDPIQPLKWIRALVILGVITLLLRALGYVNQIFGLARGSEMTGYESYIKAPVFIFGIGLCLIAVLGVLRGVKRRTLLFSIGSALILPAVLNILLAPFLFWLPSPFNNRKANRLAFQSPSVSDVANNSVSFEESWPLWNQSQLLDAARNNWPRSLKGEGGIFNWQKTALFKGDNKKWYAGVFGENVPLSSYQPRDSADDLSNAQQWKTLDLSRIAAGIPVEDGRFGPAEPGFFGLGGEPLFSSNPYIGVSVRGLSGLLWSWRLRSPFLMLRAAGKPRLISFRGTQEAAQKIAPMFVWSEARPVREGDKWFWVCDGYGVSSDFPNVDAKQDGFFAGHNFARLSVRAVQNPSEGGIRFVPPMLEQKSPSKNDPLYMLWQRAFPERFSGPPQALDLNTTLDEIELATHSGSPIWTNGGVLKTKDQFPVRVQERINEIDKKRIEDFEDDEGEFLEPGVPCAWKEQDKWWIGLVYFVVKPSQTSEQSRHIELERVLVTQLGSSLEGEGNSASSAKFNFSLKVQLEQAKKSLVTTSGTPISLELRALQAHNRAQDALRERDMVTYGQQSNIEKKLLEELIKRKNRP